MTTQQLDILVFGAHPDDAEIGMGGTIAKHAAAGYRVGICDLTHAEMSSNGTVETRRLEALEAGRILGLAERSCLGLPDRGLYVCPEQIAAITREIRRLKPRIVFAPYWRDRHPDHEMCSVLAKEAVFNAKLRHYLPGIEPVTVEKLIFYYINDVYDPSLLVDVSDVYERKRESLRAYRTQFHPADAGGDYVQTPLTQGFLEKVEARDRVLGQQQMSLYTEGFTSKVPYQIKLFE